jgi:hypothetical protein
MGAAGGIGAEGEVERGAAVDGAFGPGAPAVAFDDAMDGGQAGAGAGELAGGVQPLEGLEQLVRIGEVEADSVTHWAAMYQFA